MVTHVLLLLAFEVRVAEHLERLASSHGDLVVRMPHVVHQELRVISQQAIIERYLSPGHRLNEAADSEPDQFSTLTLQKLLHLQLLDDAADLAKQLGILLHGLREMVLRRNIQVHFLELGLVIRLGDQLRLLLAHGLVELRQNLLAVLNTIAAQADQDFSDAQ